MIWLNVTGAIITVAMGVLGLFFPARAASLTGLQAVTAAGRAEFRGTLGVTFIMLGLAPLVTREPLAFLVVGFAWLGAAVGRVISIVADDGNSRRNWGAVMFEVLVAACTLAGPPLRILGDYLA
jgi:hypothetical protein